MKDVQGESTQGSTAWATPHHLHLLTGNTNLVPGTCSPGQAGATPYQVRPLVQLFIEEELAFSGRKDDLSKYMAVKGVVFDITSRKSYMEDERPPLP